MSVFYTLSRGGGADLQQSVRSLLFLLNRSSFFSQLPLSDPWRSLSHHVLYLEQLQVIVGLRDMASHNSLMAA